MSLNLPTAIAAYFAAETSDGEAVARCFIENATVKDEGDTYSGLAAIKRWKAETSRKYTYTSEPIASEERDGKTVVTSRLTGTFPGSPVELCFFFKLDGDRIASLEIIP